MLPAARVLWLALVVLALTTLVRGIPKQLEMPEGRLGMMITRQPGQLFVIEPVRGLTAEQAGLRSGDVLLAVDGVPVDTTQPGEAQGTVGPIGTTVVLDVRRGDELLRIPVMRGSDVRKAAAAIRLSVRGWLWYQFAFQMLAVVGYVIAGFVVALRAWRQPGGLLLSAALIVIGAASSDGVNLLVAEHSLAGRAVALAFFTAVGGLLALMPDGRFAPRWSIAVLLGWAGYGLLVATTVAPQFTTGWSDTAVVTVLLVAGLAAQVQRYRRHASDLQRRQARLVVLAFAAAIAATIISSVPATYFISTNRIVELRQWQLLTTPLNALAAACVPVAIAVAVQKHGLWNVDTLVNRSAVYSLVTIVLGLSWAATAVLLQVSLEFFIGRYSTIAAAAVSSLQVAALFQPVRTHLQAWVDRRFPRESWQVEQQLNTLAADVAHFRELDVLPFIERRLREILASDDVRWENDTVHGGGVLLQSKAVRKALDAFARAVAPYVVMREVLQAALQHERAPR